MCLAVAVAAAATGQWQCRCDGADDDRNRKRNPNRTNEFTRPIDSSAHPNSIFGGDVGEQQHNTAGRWPNAMYTFVHSHLATDVCATLLKFI